MGLTRRSAALVAAGLSCSVALGAAVASRQDSPKTTRDKIYTKAQAERGAELFGKACATCHDPAKVLAGKKPAPPLSGPKFMEGWVDRTVGELLTGILTTMPNDGSMVLTEAQVADLGASILLANGFPDGAAELKYGPTSKGILIVAVK